jgi:enediyne biosynthesis protein E4
MKLLPVAVPALALVALAPLSPDQPSPQFRDVAKQAGVTPIIIAGSRAKNYVLEVNGSGLCWFDYNNDGFMDLYLVNGSTLEELQGKAPAGSHHNYLFRNNRDGTFTDVTTEARVPGKGWGFGCVAADFDNDGNTDLLVTNFGPNILYRNNGDGTFTDVTARAGVGGGDIWHTGAAFADYDNDGRLDLYVAGYLDFNVKTPPSETCDYDGVRVRACGPQGFKGAPDALYHNNGDGTFTDVTVKAGVADEHLYFGFGVIFDDFDNDGRPDIFIANDSNANYLYHNKGDGTFEEIGIPAGVAYNSDGKEHSGMGVAVGDYDHDGLMDLFITTFANDNYVLYHNEGGNFFTDVSYPSGVGEATIPLLGWGAFFLDYNNDGWKDLFCINGHVYPEVDEHTRQSYNQPLLLLENMGRGKFRKASERAGLGRLPWHSGRGGAYCDFDNDGNIDIAVSNIDGRPQLLHNTGGSGNNWVELSLSGTRSNRSAIGARVKITSGDLVQYDHVRAGGSFLSGNDPRLHFGLGAHKTIDTLEIRWPSGKVDSYRNLGANRILSLKEQ